MALTGTGLLALGLRDVMHAITQSRPGDSFWPSRAMQVGPPTPSSTFRARSSKLQAKVLAGTIRGIVLGLQRSRGSLRQALQKHGVVDEPSPF